MSHLVKGLRFPHTRLGLIACHHELTLHAGHLEFLRETLSMLLVDELAAPTQPIEVGERIHISRGRLAVALELLGQDGWRNRLVGIQLLLDHVKEVLSDLGELFAGYER